MTTDTCGGIVTGGDLPGVTQGLFELVRQHLDPKVVDPMREGQPLAFLPAVTCRNFDLRSLLLGKIDF